MGRYLIMNDIQKISITQASLKGVSFVVRTANEEGAVLLTKNDFAYALVLPMTKKGIGNFISRIEQVLINDADNEYIENLRHIYNDLIDKIDV